MSYTGAFLRTVPGASLLSPGQNDRQLFFMVCAPSSLRYANVAGRTTLVLDSHRCP